MTVKGIDVSHWQGTIEWPAIQDEYKFVFMKATEGTGFTDDQFALNWIYGAGEENLLRGAYHFWRFAWNAEQQAEHFFDTVSKTGDMGELPPVIDIEDTRSPKGPTAVHSILQTLQRTEELFGVKPIIYTAQWWWNPWTESNTGFGDYDLWVADYTWYSNVLNRPRYMPAGWADWQIWQHSCKGCVQGVQAECDLNKAKDEWYQRYITPEPPTGRTITLIVPKGDTVDVQYYV